MIITPQTKILHPPLDTRLSIPIDIAISIGLKVIWFRIGLDQIEKIRSGWIHIRMDQTYFSNRVEFCHLYRYVSVSQTFSYCVCLFTPVLGNAQWLIMCSAVWLIGLALRLHSLPVVLLPKLVSLEFKICIINGDKWNGKRYIIATWEKCYSDDFSQRH
jgi:hypothetical protein